VGRLCAMAAESVVARGMFARIACTIRGRVRCGQRELACAGINVSGRTS
jgi:hypothetical protein